MKTSEMSRDAKIRFLTTQVEIKRGIVQYEKSRLRTAENDLAKCEESLYVAEFVGEPCKKDYYAVSGGECKWGESIPHGDIVCANPNCQDYCKAKSLR